MRRGPSQKQNACLRTIIVIVVVHIAKVCAAGVSPPVHVRDFTSGLHCRVEMAIPRQVGSLSMLHFHDADPRSHTTHAYLHI